MRIVRSALFGPDQAPRDGKTGEAGGVMDVELRHQVGAMRFDGLDREREPRGDGLVAVALRDELKHFALTRRQPVELARGAAQ